MNQLEATSLAESFITALEIYLAHREALRRGADVELPREQLVETLANALLGPSK